MLGKHIAFNVLNRDNGSKGVLLASPVVGDYKIMHSQSLVIRKHDRLNFTAPCCSVMLNTDDDRWAKIVLKNKKAAILFSTVVGERATYKVVRNRKPEAFGRDAHKAEPKWEGMAI